MFYEKLNAKFWQEMAAMYAEWSLDYLLNGEIAKATADQKIAAYYADLSRTEMNITA